MVQLTGSTSLDWTRAPKSLRSHSIVCLPDLVVFYLIDARLIDVETTFLEKMAKTSSLCCEEVQTMPVWGMTPTRWSVWF